MGSKTSRSAKSTARQAQSSSGMKVMARIGYATSGLLHLVLGAIVVGLGLPDTDDGEASASGALAEISDRPFGQTALAVLAVGLAALSLWHILTALRGGRARDRLKFAGKAIVQLVLAILAAQFALDIAGSGADEEGLTREVMSYPAGRIVIAAIGAGILIAGIVHVVIGFTKSFSEEMSTGAGRPVGRAVLGLGRLGYWAKGIALAVLGGLFGLAAWNADPEETGGLDEAFATIGDQPFGSTLLIITGAGIACFGLFCFAQARYQRL